MIVGLLMDAWVVNCENGSVVMSGKSENEVRNKIDNDFIDKHGRVIEIKQYDFVKEHIKFVKIK